MVAEQPVDISNVPELVRLVDEIQRTGRPRVLQHANMDVAVLSPLPKPRRPRPKTARRRLTDPLAVVARTAGALRSDIPFPGIDAERGAAEDAMAADAISSDR